MEHFIAFDQDQENAQGQAGNLLVIGRNVAARAWSVRKLRFQVLGSSALWSTLLTNN
jgi:hypothetical protein